MEEKTSRFENTTHKSSRYEPGPKDLLNRIIHNTQLTAVNTAVNVVRGTGDDLASFTLLASKFLLSDEDPLEIVSAPKVYTHAFEEGVAVAFVDPETLRSFFVFRIGCYFIFFLAGCALPSSASHKLGPCVNAAAYEYQQNLVSFFKNASGHKGKKLGPVYVEAGKVFVQQKYSEDP